MGLERDVRQPLAAPPAPELLIGARAAVLPAGLATLGTNPYTGTPARYCLEREAPTLRSATSFSKSRTAWIEEARRWLCPHGLGGWRFAELPVRRRTSAGIEIRWLAQRWARIPVFEGYRALRFDAEGQLEEIFGDHAPMPCEVTVEPKITARRAFAAAVEHVAALPLTRLGARRVLFYHHPRLRVSWDLELSLGAGDDELQVIVDAAENPGEILYCRSLLATAVRGLVYRTNPGEGERVEIDWPQDWIETETLRGNNTRCHVANDLDSLAGERAGDDLRFAPPADLGADQWQVNAFAWVNSLHDFFAQHGFGEAEGNLQKENHSGRGRGEDELVLRIFPEVRSEGPLATMSTRRDGKRCEMRLWPAAEGCHTALDADVVIHEYAHAVINRLVGGPDDSAPLRAPQSLGLAEGYADYFALSLQNHERDAGVFEIGRWIRACTGKALRGNVYDETFPGHFGLLGTVAHTEPHNVGEIWCMALLRFNTVLGAHLGDRRQGDELGWQLVIDSLKLLPVGSDKPSFLEARDALFRALDDRLAAMEEPLPEPETLAAAVREVFTRLGMGPQARSRGASLAGAEPDFGG